MAHDVFDYIDECDNFSFVVVVIVCDGILFYSDLVPSRVIQKLAIIRWRFDQKFTLSLSPSLSLSLRVARRSQL